MLSTSNAAEKIMVDTVDKVLDFVLESMARIAMTTETHQPGEMVVFKLMTNGLGHLSSVLLCARVCRIDNNFFYGGD